MSENLENVEMSALFLAIATYAAQFIVKFVSAHFEKRAEFNRMRNEYELSRINFQLKDIFGPMLSGLLVSKAAFSELMKRHSNGKDPTNDAIGAFFLKLEEPVKMETTTLSNDGESFPNFSNLNDQQKDWVLWVTTILQPSNHRFLEIIVNNTHGFDCRIPGYAMDIMAHIKEFDVIIAKWKLGDFTHMNPRIPFNDRINVFVQQEMTRLQTRQRKLLRNLHNDNGTAEALLENDETEVKLVGDIRVHPTPDMQSTKKKSVFLNRIGTGLSNS